VGHDFEELLRGHFFGYLGCVFAVDGVPVEADGLLFVVEEAVVFVDELPKGFEVVLPGVLGVVAGDAGGSGLQ
jgi:hypothetical protein